MPFDNRFYLGQIIIPSWKMLQTLSSFSFFFVRLNKLVFSVIQKYTSMAIGLHDPVNEMNERKKEKKRTLRLNEVGRYVFFLLLPNLNLRFFSSSSDEIRLLILNEMTFVFFSFWPPCYF